MTKRTGGGGGLSWQTGADREPGLCGRQHKEQQATQPAQAAHVVPPSSTDDIVPQEVCVAKKRSWERKYPRRQGSAPGLPKLSSRA